MLENLVDEKPVRSCRIRSIRDELDEKDAVLFMQYINDIDGWAAHTLARALTSRGVIIDPKAITRHRLNHCTCRFLNVKQS